MKKKWEKYFYYYIFGIFDRMIWLFSRSDYRLQKRKTLFWIFGQLYGQVYAHDEEEIGKIFPFLEYLIILQIWLQEEDSILNIWEIPLQGKLLYSLVNFIFAHDEEEEMGKILPFLEYLIEWFLKGIDQINWCN